MKKIKSKKDRILEIGRSPLDNDPYWFSEEEMEAFEFTEDISADDGGLVVSGEMEVGTAGHPVTIKITDEVTGMEMELSHVKNALMVIEDKRRSSSGWLSLLVGDVEKVSGVLRFIAKATVDELRRLTSRGDKSRD